MAGDTKKLQPIIIKRIRKGGHNKHGGAWKIAYADFVTAMMAFFLLMWLLGSTTEGDKKGIADFFNAPLKVALMGGSGAGDSSHVVRGGGQDLTRTTGQVKDGDVPGQEEAPQHQVARGRAEARRAGQARGAEAEGRGRARGEPQAGGDALADPPRHDARRPAHPDRRRAEPADVRQRQRRREALHARAAAGDRPRPLGRAEPDHPRGPHRRAPVQRRRARLQQLGALERPRQRLAARNRRAAGCPRTGCCSSRGWRRAISSCRASRPTR